MPTVVIWNIEKYGQLHGDNILYAGRHAAIKHILTVLEADLLLIQEFRSSGPNVIANLRQVLGDDDWNYDYIKGALAVEYDENENDNNAKQKLEWSSNSEGYAALWRNMALDDLGNLGWSEGENGENGEDGKYTLSLFVEGNIPDPEMAEPFAFHDQMRYGNSGYPIEKDLTGKYSEGEVSSSRLNIDYSANNNNHVQSAQIITKARRPCYCSWNTTYVAAYHAPVATNSSIKGTQIAGLSRLVRNTDLRLIIGGDFNIVGSDDRELAFANFINAGMRAVDDDIDAKSTVHYANQMDPSNPNTELNAYQGSARDQIFYRESSFEQVEGGVKDILSDLNDPNNRLTQLILNDADIKVMVNDYRPEGMLNEQDWFTAWENLKAKFDNPADGFDGYFNCAMFYAGYVSDHLPLVATFNE